MQKLLFDVRLRKALEMYTGAQDSPISGWNNITIRGAKVKTALYKIINTLMFDTFFAYML